MAIAAIMLMTAACFAVGCTKPDEPNNGGNNNGGNSNSGNVGNSLNGHEYVILGLPSGTRWATCNVGATSPEGYGNYFAWGEVIPKTTYNWSTYKYCNGNYNQLTKYCDESNLGYNGFTDNLTTLQSGDDAATTNWGNGWYMPTWKDWEELYQHTTNTWTTRNGVSGRLFTASNGNSLFLPAAGCTYRREGELYDVGRFGYYWSSGLNYHPEAAYDCNVCSGYCLLGSKPRYYGLSVRPVCSAGMN